MQLKKVIAAIFLPVFLFSCSSTKIKSSWKAENVQLKTYYNVMVWGLMPEKDSNLRKQMEMHLVNDLITKGYHAVSSMEVYKAKANKKLSSNEILSEFKSTGIDAVITISLLNKEKEVKYYPGGVHLEPSENFGDLNNYYCGIYERVFTPGYYITSSSYFWESSLFEVKDEKMIYSARTRSFDPANTESLAHENGLKIIKDMVRKKVILVTTSGED